ncbi:MAG: DUF3224 domain-containing protein [Gemmatimonadaceae bacterium]|nr:DUF3224 domain-containing protein [Gemmatimonadaceae bacterium]
MTARGTFEVTITPQTSNSHDGITEQRAGLDKRYHGHLDAVGAGTMLSTTTAAPGSAGYVAMERVAGTLHGRRGAFVLQHHGLMQRGQQQLSVTIVPDSGTGELAGITGQCHITVAKGAHSYELHYTLGVVR